MPKAIKTSSPFQQDNDLLKIRNRLSNLENTIEQIKIELAKTTIRLEGELPHFATKTDKAELEGKLNTEIAKSTWKIIIWLIGISAAGAIIKWILPYLT